MTKIILILCALIFSAFTADVNYAKPIPTIENPRKIIIQVNHNDEHTLSGVLNNISNILAAYGPEIVNIRVVAYSDGIVIVKKQDNPFTDRIKNMMDVGVEFVACGNTMSAKNLTMNDLLDGTQYVRSGIAEIIERQKDGWIYVRP